MRSCYFQGVGGMSRHFRSLRKETKNIFFVDFRMVDRPKAGTFPDIVLFYGSLNEDGRVVKLSSEFKSGP